MRHARVIVALLTLPGFVAVAAPASAGPDPEPLADAVDWLVDHLPDDDLGQRIEIALALDAVGAHPDTVAGIRADAEAEAGSYAGQSAEAAARIVELAVATGEDPADFGGVDLVERLESFVDGSGSASPDTAVQARVVGALDEVGSDRLDDATGVLLARQCADGSFAPGPACEELPLDPAVVATARAVLALEPQREQSDVVGRAVRDAMDVMLARQSFDTGGLGGTTAINAWAARAFAALGETEAAAMAASWVRSRQMTSVGRCADYAPGEDGAVAHDDAGWYEESEVPEYVAATAAALPVLPWTEARVGQPVLLDEGGYVRAGESFTVRIDDLAPGESVCMVLPGFGHGIVHADARGRYLTFANGLRDGESTEVAFATVDGTFASATYTGLAERTLPVAVRKKVAAGARQTVRVTGLAPAEAVSVKVGRARVARGAATPDGTFVASFDVTGKPRTVRVAVRGEFETRTGAATFRVTR